MEFKVGAIVVTYNPNLHVGALLNALLAQVSHIYIVDNGSAPEILSILQGFADKNKGFTKLISNKENMGIATAQNQGIEEALKAGFEWILFMDDDSIPQPGMVAQMLASYHLQNNNNIGIIAPRLVEQNVNLPSRHLVNGNGIFFKRIVVDGSKNLTDVLTVIASGSMIKAEVFNHIGRMREGFFIDYVDHEFCLRAVTNNYKIMVVGRAVLNHKQGNKRYENIAGIKLRTSNYNALRYYYIFRNRMFFLRLYGAKKPLLISHELFACALDVFRIISGEEKKFTKLKAMIRGLKEGVLRSIPN